jgi:hypothetical protein
VKLFVGMMLLTGIADALRNEEINTGPFWGARRAARTA